MHYSGNLDIVVNVPMTEAFLEHVVWSGQERYRQSHRQQWWVEGHLAGWVVTIGNFTRVRHHPAVSRVVQLGKIVLTRVALFCF